jgi:formylglycine-generating enzyme required for sulfatase activity
MEKKWWIGIGLFLLLVIPFGIDTYYKARAEKIEGMVYIPAGEFLMGTEKEKKLDSAVRDPERKKLPWTFNSTKKTVYVGGFYIDKYEVTNGQYLEFVKETGHKEPCHWKDGMYPLGGKGLPVVNVSLNDARAYASWRGKRLPSREEWEKAAGGEYGLTFPWGNEFCGWKTNTWESGIRKLTSVDAYEEGKSPFGIYGMSGNVMEWTSSHGNHPDEYLRIIKGGSWASDGFDARVQSGLVAPPDIITNALGFRCAYTPYSGLFIANTKNCFELFKTYVGKIIPFE